MDFARWAKELVSLTERQSAENWELWATPEGIVVVLALVAIASAFVFCGPLIAWVSSRLNHWRKR